MANKEILEIAMKQSAIDSNCSLNDFCSFNNLDLFNFKLS